MDVSVDEVLLAEGTEEESVEGSDAGVMTPPELAILLYDPPSATINYAESITLTATVAAEG